MDGFAACLASPFRGFHNGPTVALIQRLLFVRPRSWDHAATILRVVNGIPTDSLLDGHPNPFRA
jgi:hypothetical protein